MLFSWCVCFKCCGEERSVIGKECSDQIPLSPSHSLKSYDRMKEEAPNERKSNHM